MGELKDMIRLQVSLYFGVSLLGNWMNKKNSRDKDDGLDSRAAKELRG